MIFRPYHLLGVETATSVLTASHLKLPPAAQTLMNWISSWFADETVNIASASQLNFGNHMREIEDAMV